MNQEKTLTNRSIESAVNSPSHMKAAVIAAPGKIEIVSAPVPEPLENEVRIKIEACGICGSDLPVWQGREWFSYPFEAGAPGHEGFGIIDKVGSDVSGFDEGDRVAMLSYHAYAQYDIAKADEVVKLNQDHVGIPFPGEPLACAMNIFKRAEISKNDVVAVIGAGFIGNLLIQLSKSAGAVVIAISQREIALQLAFEAGANHIIKLDDHYEIIKKVNEITKNQGCSRVIEATGKQWPLDLAGDLVGIRGKLVIAGYHQDGLRQVNVQNWNWKGIDVINAHERDPRQYIRGMKEAVFAIENNALNPSMLYSHVFELENIAEAFELMNSRTDNMLKILVKCH